MERTTLAGYATNVSYASVRDAPTAGSHTRVMRIARRRYVELFVRYVRPHWRRALLLTVLLVFGLAFLARHLMDRYPL